MARIDSKVIFVTTSPRTPSKMIPEIELLSRNFEGQEWNNETQISFMALLKEENLVVLLNVCCNFGLKIT